LRRRGRRTATEALTIFRDRPHAGTTTSTVGITVGKTVGIAVVRNKIRRRIGAILHEALAAGEPMRLLVIARPQAAQAPYAALRLQLAAALAS
jgi:ribonuclease P protein component